MMNRVYRSLAITLCSLSLLSPLAAENAISFKGGYTRAVMVEGREAIVLTQGASVEVGNIALEAQRIELIGPASRYVTGTGKVGITDSENGVTISTNKISFDRETSTLLADGWVEVEDIPHELVASGGYLNYNSESGLMTLHVSAFLARNTSEGVMKAQGNTITINSEKGIITIAGNARITYKDNLYSAAITIINTETNEIEMSGDIQGEIDG